MKRRKIYGFLYNNQKFIEGLFRQIFPNIIIQHIKDVLQKNVTAVILKFMILEGASCKILLKFNNSLILIHIKMK